MSQEAQAPESPVQEPSLSPLRDGVGTTRAEAEASVAQRNAEVQAKIDALRAKAKADLLASFRQTQGVAPAPQVAPQANIAPVPVSPQANAPVDPNDFAKALTAQLNEQFQAAERVRQEAQAQAQEAQRRAQQAEAQLAQFKTNPAAYLQQEGLTIDEWNARLLNGGEATPEEKRLAAESAKWEAKVKGLESQVTQVKQHFEADQQARAVAELQPVLKNFPLVNKLLGPQALIQELRNHVQTTGKAFTSAEQTMAAISNLESQLTAQYRATLQDETIATKLGLSVKSPQAVVAESPQTLSNRVTSTVAPQSSRPMTERERIARGRALVQQLVAASGSRRAL